MKFHNIIISQILLTTIVGNNAWAQSTYTITDGVHDWDVDRVINGVSGSPGSGLRGDGSLIAIINSASNIDVSNNFSGMFLSNSASVTINNTNTDSVFSASDNGWEGILVESGADLTVNGMNISANGNVDNGIRADTGGVITITDAGKLTFNNNEKKGMFAFSDDSAMSITGKNDNSSYLYVNDNNTADNWGAEYGRKTMR